MAWSDAARAAALAARRAHSGSKIKSVSTKRRHGQSFAVVRTRSGARMVISSKRTGGTMPRVGHSVHHYGVKMNTKLPHAYFGRITGSRKIGGY